MFSEDNFSELRLWKACHLQLIVYLKLWKCSHPTHFRSLDLIRAPYLYSQQSEAEGKYFWKTPRKSYDNMAEVPAAGWRWLPQEEFNDFVLTFFRASISPLTIPLVTACGKQLFRVITDENFDELGTYKDVNGFTYFIYHLIAW